MPGVEPLRRELLLDTLNYYRQFLRYAGDEPELRADLAVTWSKSAGVAMPTKRATRPRAWPDIAGSQAFRNYGASPWRKSL